MNAPNSADATINITINVQPKILTDSDDLRETFRIETQPPADEERVALTVSQLILLSPAARFRRDR